MIKSLFIVSSLLILIGLFNFIKKKPVLGWLFMLAGIAGIAVAFVVVSLYPDKI